MASFFSTSNDSSSFSFPSTSTINMPRSKNFMMNHKGNLKLHFRVFFPSECLKTPSEIDSVLFWIPGYTAHVNRMEMTSQAGIVTAQNRAFFMLDMMGHGYSEGTRALVTDFKDMVDDVLDFIANIMSLSSSEIDEERKPVNNESFHCEDLDSNVLNAIKRKNFYIMGQSMGVYVYVCII